MPHLLLSYQFITPNKLEQLCSKLLDPQQAHEELLLWVSSSGAPTQQARRGAPQFCTGWAQCSALHCSGMSLRRGKTPSLATQLTSRLVSAGGCQRELMPVVIPCEHRAHIPALHTWV